MLLIDEFPCGSLCHRMVYYWKLTLYLRVNDALNHNLYILIIVVINYRRCSCTIS